LKHSEKLGNTITVAENWTKDLWL